MRACFAVQRQHSTRPEGIRRAAYSVMHTTPREGRAALAPEEGKATLACGTVTDVDLGEWLQCTDGQLQKRKYIPPSRYGIAPIIAARRLRDIIQWRGIPNDYRLPQMDACERGLLTEEPNGETPGLRGNNDRSYLSGGHVSVIANPQAESFRASSVSIMCGAAEIRSCSRARS